MFSGRSVVMKNLKLSLMFYAILIPSLLFMPAGCSKEGEVPSADVAPAGSAAEQIDSLVKGENIRRNGFVEIETYDVDDVKVKTKDLISGFNAQIIEESINVKADKRFILKYKIKLQAEFFSEFIEKVTALGEILDINIISEDVSDEITQKNDAVELLRERLSRAKKSNDAALVDSLQKSIDNALKEKAALKKSVLYSYLHLTVYESTKISHAFSLGVGYGKEGFVWMVKIVLIIIMSVIPLLALYLAIKVVAAFFRWRWNRLIQYIENIGKGRGADSGSKE